MSTLTELEPYRPIFVALSLGLLALAWVKLFRQPVACESGRACAAGAVQRRQRLIFWAVAALLLLLLTFPWYASLFY